MHVLSNWTQCEIIPSGDSLSKRMACLRKKISKHKCSQFHISTENIIHRSKLETMDLQIIKNNKLQYESIEKIFRTAYFIAKNQRPFLGMPKLIDLQALNGINMGRVLQINKSCVNIVDHFSNEMRLKICKDITENNSNLSIVVDESTKLSKKLMLVICLRCVNGDSQGINIYFFDIIELNCTSAESIKTAIINNMLKHGIKLDFLKQNLVGFVSDGASNMLGRKGGVGVLLQKIFPDLIIWHVATIDWNWR